MKMKLFVASFFTLALINTGWADTTPMQGGFQPAATPPAAPSTPAPDAGSNQIIVDEGGALHYQSAPPAGSAQPAPGQAMPAQPAPGQVMPAQPGVPQPGSSAVAQPAQPGIQPNTTAPQAGMQPNATMPPANANAGQAQQPAEATAPDTPGMSAAQPTPAQ